MEHGICYLEESRLSGTCGGNLEEAAGLVEHVIGNLEGARLSGTYDLQSEEAIGLVEHVVAILKRLQAQWNI